MMCPSEECMSRTLDLVLKHKWFDMIACGEKKEEYREIKPFWENRFTKFSYSEVCFHRGYTSMTMTWKIKRIKRGIGNPKWGAPSYEVFIIELEPIHDVPR